MPAALAAAHIGHEIEHSMAFWGFLAGAVIGLAAGALIVAATVATGGAALAVVAAVGGAVASTGGGALAGMYIGEAIKNPKGPISSGSPNVFYGPGKIPAARAVIDTVACKDHGTKFLATGSDSVFLNQYPAVRDDDKSECDGTVNSPIDHIFIGAETVQYLEIESEVPEWMVNVALGMVIVGSTVAIVFGAAAAFSAAGLCGLINFGGQMLGGIIGSAILAPLGGMIGEGLGGELGKRIGETLGGLLGGALGGGLGNRLSSGHPVDVATGELFTQDIDFVIGGIITLPFERFWISSSTQNGALGQKWHHPFDMELAEAVGHDVLRVEHGRLILLPHLAPGEAFYHRAEKLTAIRDDEKRWTIQRAGLLYRLDADPLRAGRFRLVAIEDFNQNRIPLIYGDKGQLLQAVGTDGLVYDFAYDPAGRIRKISKSDGETTIRLVSYDYDEYGDLVATTDRSDVPFRYEYKSHLLTRETRRSGLSFHFEWDELGLQTDARCTKTWGDGNIYYREFAYYPEIRQTKVRSANNAIETYHYNEIGIVTEVITPMGGHSYAVTNRYAEQESETDPNGGVTIWRHDEFGRVIAITDATDATTTLEYASDDPRSPAFFLISQETDALGAESSVEFDPRGNMIGYTDKVGHSVRILRDTRGLPLNMQDDDGTLARYGWTPEGYLRDERTARGGMISFQYDSFGRVLVEEVEGLAPIEVSYDSADRPILLKAGEDERTEIVYDAEGRVVERREPGGHVYKWHYNGLPDPVLRINPDGSRFAYDYDNELNLIRLRNEVGDEYRLEYDLDQRMIAETGFDGRRQSYDYDPANNVIRLTDGARVHDLVRDPLGRLLERRSADGSWAKYGYDREGRLITADNEDCKVAFIRNPLGLVLSEIQNGIETSHSYSARGERTMTVLPDGRFIKFGYNDIGNFDSLTVGEREVLSLRHDRMGRLRERRAGRITEQIDYDPQGRIQRQLAYRNSHQNPVFGRSYDYNRAGQIEQITDVARGEISFAYDQLDQLRRVKGSRNEVFSFDPAGNIIADVETPRDASVQNGRLMLRGDCHYEYDDAGNRISLRRGQGGGHVFTYDYDALNQLRQVHEVRGRTERVTRFTYDALGRRVSKSHREILVAANSANPPPAVDASELVQDQTTWFLWNGDVLLAEGRGDAGGAVDPTAIVYVFEPDSFRPAAQIRRHSPEAEGEVMIFWVDHLGTPQEVSNERGELVWQVSLKAWGGIDTVYTARIENNLRFQGQYYDAETGLHYNRFRHYDPAAGCFLNQDPIGLAGGVRLSGYVGNPTTWIDPMGLNSWHDFLHKHAGEFNSIQEASEAYRKTPAYKLNNIASSSHGNAASNRPAVLYAIVDKNGNFQKWGITQETKNPRARYSGPTSFDGEKLPPGHRIERVAIGTRSEMRSLERSLAELGGGPKNKESWSSSRPENGGKSLFKGLTERLRTGDLNGVKLTERQRLAINNALSMGCKF